MFAPFMLLEMRNVTKIREKYDLGTRMLGLLSPPLQCIFLGGMV